MLAKFRAKVRDQAFVQIHEQRYEVVSSAPSQVPPIRYDLSEWIGREVVIEGYLTGQVIQATQIIPLVEYQAPPALNQHRLGTTLHPLNDIRPLNWRNAWSFTHALEPDEPTPWNDPLFRHPNLLVRVIRFLAVEKTPRYQPRPGWLGNTVFVSDYTRLMHCEIALDPLGKRKWFNYVPANMVSYIKLVSTVEDDWWWVETSAEAQNLANQGLPVIALRADAPEHLAVVVVGKLNEGGFPLVAQAGRRNFSAGYWEDPLVQYIAHT